MARLLAALVLSLVALSACDGAPGAATFNIRNVSAASVTVQFSQPNKGPLGGWLGPDRRAYVVEPWRVGWCPAARYSVYPGMVTVTVHGSGIVGSVSQTLTATSGMPDLNILITTDGSVQFGGPVPAISSPCESYPLAPTGSAAFSATAFQNSTAARS